MAFLLSSSQTSNGEFYGQGKFNYSLPETRRRIVSASCTTNQVVFTLTASTVNKNPFAATTSTNTDRVRIVNCAPFNGTWPVSGVGTNTVTLKITGVTSSWTANVGLQSMMYRVTSSGSNKSENRLLSNYKFNWSKSLSGMCTTQASVYTMLTDFFKDPEIEREYRAKYALYSTEWDDRSSGNDFGPTGTYNLTKIVNSFMCTVHGESRWRHNVMPVDGVPTAITKTQASANYNDYLSGNVPVGLWQIDDQSPAFWPSNATTKDHNDWPVLFNREYNTRIALWIMFRSLFKSDLTGVSTKPFRHWGGSRLSTSADYSSCITASIIPPYGTKTCTEDKAN